MLKRAARSAAGKSSIYIYIP